MRTAIIGNGVAGITVARLLREQDAQSDLDVFTRETFPYYARPQLIELLAGAIRQEALSFYPQDWYERQRMGVHYGETVHSIDPKTKELVLGGTRHAFDWLVIASGSDAFRPPIAHAELPGVFTLRTLADALAIKDYAALHGCENALVVGGGLLGLEAAHALRRIGINHVTVLEHNLRLLPRQLDAEGAHILQRILASKGLGIELGASCRSFGGDERVEKFLLEDGRSFPADLVLLSAGVRPALDFLAGSGIAINKGILSDDRLQTNIPQVLALGDVAEWQGKIWGIIPPILDQAPVVVSTILGGDRSYQGSVASNTLKVLGVDLLVAGVAQPSPGNLCEVRVANEDRQTYIKLVFEGVHLVGAICLGYKKLQAQLNRWVAEKKQMTVAEAHAIVDQNL
ncbi:MAG: FAD-dependent oxidoreductase [Coprothermobacterota bacterium]|nr:FAD-dependent oxidoreductase [Coprothermobacterota bacterium]